MALDARLIPDEAAVYVHGRDGRHLTGTELAGLVDLLALDGTRVRQTHDAIRLALEQVPAFENALEEEELTIADPWSGPENGETAGWV